MCCFMMQCKAVGIIGQFMVCAMLQSEGQSYFISAAAVLLFIVKSNEWWPLRFSDRTRQDEQQLDVFTSAALTETVLAELVLSS